MAVPYSGSNVKIGAGTLYAAPLGTAEPTSVTGAWTGWETLGFTDQGSEFDLTPTVVSVEVEETYWAVRKAITGYEGSMTFSMAETTQRNFLLAMNAGIGSSLVSGTSGSDGAGTVWSEMPDIGFEVRVMIGWDALSEGATSGADPFGRIICRQTLQTSAVKRMARKGNNKSMFSCVFSFEKPDGKLPFRFLQPAYLA